jgi:hypothetical protein
VSVDRCERRGLVFLPIEDVIEGVGLAILWPQFAAMAGIAAVLLTLCILRFRKSLE